jgi:hypothetical protein
MIHFSRKKESLRAVVAKEALEAIDAIEKRFQVCRNIDSVNEKLIDILEEYNNTYGKYPDVISMSQQFDSVLSLMQKERDDILGHLPYSECLGDAIRTVTIYDNRIEVLIEPYEWDYGLTSESAANHIKYHIKLKEGDPTEGERIVS